MYRHLYGLKDKPFQISTDPSFLWLGQKHKEAMAVLVYGVRNAKGFLLLSGGVGTGKTTLIRALLGQLDKKVTVATVHDPGLTHMDFFNFIATAYGMRKRYTNKVDFLFDFEDLLRKTRAAGRTALLIVDEAQRLDQALLEEIRLLSNIEDPDQKLLNVFFVGQEEFLDIIADPQNRALKQRITINYHLETLSMEETEQLVRHRLKVAGATREVFTPDAYPGIFTFSLGAPRLINIICDHALLTGFVHNVNTIGADIIAECTHDLMLPGEHAARVDEPADNAKPTAATVTAGMMLQNAPPPIKRRLWPWAAAAMLLLTIGIAFLWQRGWHPLILPLNMAQVTPSVPAEETPPESVTPPESTAPPPPETLIKATPEPMAPASSVPVLPPMPVVTLDTRETTPPVEAADTRTLARQEAPEPAPPEDIAGQDQVDQSAPGSNREAPFAPAATAPTAITDIDKQQPENLSETTPDERDTRVIQETNDEIETHLSSPSGTVQSKTTKAVADRAVLPLQTTLPDAVHPTMPPPAAPVTEARTEPETTAPSPLAAPPKPTSELATGSILGLPDATATMTTSAPLPYPTEDKIKDFIRAYRKAYESRDINRFRLFFTEDALELNRPISAALPVYQHNFEALAALDYDITLKAWVEDETSGQVTLQGKFVIRYRMSESAWQSTQGEISMDLVETGGIYRIKRLDYWKE